MDNHFINHGTLSKVLSSKEVRCSQLFFKSLLVQVKLVLTKKIAG